MNKKTAAVSGGAGFIGSHLTNYLIKHGYNVLVIDNLSTGKIQNVNKSAIFLKSNVLSTKSKDALEKFKPNVFFHLAAQSSLQESVKNPIKDIENNFLTTVTLLDWLKNFKCNKFVFSSSAAVYGDRIQSSFKENDPVDPQTPYGISKLASENYIKFFNNQKKLPFCILRFSNVYGPLQNDSAEGGVVAIFIKKTLSGEPIIVNGTGKQTRDFIYVDDVVRALYISRKPGLVGTFNISKNKETQIIDLAKKIIKFTKVDYHIKYHPQMIFDVKKSKLSNKLFVQKSRWTPVISLDKGLIKTISSFR